MIRAVLVAVAAALIVAAWLFRYEIVATQRAGAPAAYELDRWTGRVTLIMVNSRVPEE